MKTAMLALLAMFSPLAMAAGAASPVGHWQTVDDKTGKPRAIIEIYTEGSRYFGRLERSYTPGAEHRTCVKCEDDRKDKPMLGLVLIRNLVQDDDVWSGGDILDPDNGSVYRCRLTLSADGQTLNVRGYIGFALLGRTQVWHRVSAEQAAAVNPPEQK
jgi:uncharacterized protein (DUF2147 family)